MKITLKETPEQIELIKALGSKDATASRGASEALASFIGPVIQEVLRVAGTSTMIFTDTKYNEDDYPSYPLDLYFAEDAGYVSVWSQNMAGGLPTNQVEGVKEMKIATYRLDTAVSFNKKYARRSRLDVVSKALARMANEVLIKQERNAWAVVLAALAQASTKNKNHLVRSGTAGVFLIDDLSKLITLMKRINAAYNQGTTDMADARGVTDLIVSPEIKEQIRGFAYNPLNTRIGVTAGTAGAGYAAQGIALPDSIREGLFKNAGAQEIYGIGITDINELGVGFTYNTLLTTFAGATSYATPDGTTRTGTFNNATEQVLVGIDASRDAFIRPVAVNADSGATFVAQPDDQFFIRQEKVGFYGSLEEGRVCIDARAVVGLIV